MAAEENCAVEVGNLLYPELLSREELVQILLSRCVQKQLLEGLDKYQLVDLFQRIVLPLPQRTYSDNRRGKMLNSLRKKTERNVKTVDNESSAGSRIANLSSISRHDVQPSHKKHDSNKSHDSLDHIIINDRRKRPKVDEESRNKPVELPKISDTESKSSSVIKLKRPMAVSESPSTKPKEGEEDDKKKKRRIVWP
ncbi:ashwin-like [Hetaerina americana]|uniref:ashwin-like n=1 Tax=Hetaerina americana TaxID=62018 RepID=UPI003A7F48D7